MAVKKLTFKQTETFTLVVDDEAGLTDEQLREFFESHMEAGTLEDVELGMESWTEVGDCHVTLIDIEDITDDGEVRL